MQPRRTKPNNDKVLLLAVVLCIVYSVYVYFEVYLLLVYDILLPRTIFLWLAFSQVFKTYCFVTFSLFLQLDQ